MQVSHGNGVSGTMNTVRNEVRVHLKRKWQPVLGTELQYVDYVALLIKARGAGPRGEVRLRCQKSEELFEL